MYIALTILQLLSALAVTVIVLFQSGKRSGLSGAIAGGADTFLSKGKAKTLDAKLAKAPSGSASPSSSSLWPCISFESHKILKPAARVRAVGFLFTPCRDTRPLHRL